MESPRRGDYVKSHYRFGSQKIVWLKIESVQKDGYRGEVVASFPPDSIKKGTIISVGSESVITGLKLSEWDKCVTCPL